MAYDRYERGDHRRDHHRDDHREHGRDEERGFFDKVGDWFSGDDDHRRHRGHERGRGDDWGGWNDRDRETRMGRDRDSDRSRYAIGGWGEREPEASYRDRDRYDRSSRPMNWTSSNSDYRQGSHRDRDLETRSGFGGASRDYMQPTGPSYGYDRSESEWGRDDYRRTSYAGSTRGNDRDYDEWRRREMDRLDRDYHDYCRERQGRFESDFGSWRQERMSKREQLGGIREHMDVVGSDGDKVGSVDCVKGDRIILTKSDSDDNRHHSIDCSMIRTIEGDKVCLDVPAEEAKSRFHDEDKGGGFFGDDRDRDDRHRGPEHAGPNLERSFSGTYR